VALNAMGIFLLFGSIMSATAGFTLTFPGSPLDALWALNPVAYRQMLPLRKIVGIPMLGVSTALLCAAIGWFRRRRWGWILAVLIIASQVAGDAANIFLGRFQEGVIGATIASFLLWWLCRKPVRTAFNRASN